jgi:D-xylulose reductase
MMEPLAVGVHSVYTLAQVRPNQVVAVFGAGPVGLLAMAVARACGARRVIAIDIMESRLEFAKSYAATDVFCPPKPHKDESQIAYSKRSNETLKKGLGVADTGVAGVDVVIEATGAEACIQTGFYLIKPGGIFIQIGMGSLDVQVPIHLLLSKEFVVKGSFR